MEQLIAAAADTTPIDVNTDNFMAEVIDAHVHSSYWDATKKQFRPMRDDVPPYLTFFGAQTFGYVRNR